jgi:hypothetical protein
MRGGAWRRDADNEVQDAAQGIGEKFHLPNAAEPEPSPLRREFRNSNLEIRNKPKHAMLKRRRCFLHSVFSDLSHIGGFELVSDFELRASDFKRAHASCAGFARYVKRRLAGGFP